MSSDKMIEWEVFKAEKCGTMSALVGILYNRLSVMVEEVDDYEVWEAKSELEFVRETLEALEKREAELS